MRSLGEQFREWVLAQRVLGTAPVSVGSDKFRIHTPAATAEVNLYPFQDGREIVEYRIVRADAEDENTFFLHFMLDDMARAQELFGELVEALSEEVSREPTHVLLSCTSALTTSLFASKMNDVAQTLALDYDFRAMSVDAALGTTEPFSAILLAPQVAHLRRQMMEAHPDALVFEIPAKIFGSYDAPGVVRLLMKALRDVSDDAEGAASLRAVRDLHDDKRVLAITLFLMRDFTRLGYRLYDRGVVVAEGSVRKQRFDYRDVEDLVQSLLAREVDVHTLDAIGIAVPGVTRRGMVALPGIVEGNVDLGVKLSRRFGLPVYVDNNCNAAAVGCYVSQDEWENLLFYRHAFGHAAGGMGTLIDGRLLKGHGNLAGEPRYFERRFAASDGTDELFWSAEGMHQVALDVSVTSAGIVAPDALYLAVDTVDDAEAFQADLVAVLGEAYAPQVHIVTDYVERVYLGTLALALQKLHDPKYRSLGVDVR